MVGKWRIVVLIAVLSLVSMWFSGYSFSTGDQSLYVPQVLKRVDSELFERDYLKDLPEAKLSLFFPLMAGILKTTDWDIERLYFGLYALIHFLVLLSIFDLSVELTRKPATALLATALLALPKFVGGTTITTIDTAWLPRLLTLPLLIVGVKLLIQKRFMLAAITAAFITLFHPFSGLMLSFFLVGFLLSSRVKLKQWFSAGLIVSVPLSWILIQSFSKDQNFVMSGDWFRLARERLPYNFLSQWELSGWASLGLTLLLIISFVKVFRHKSKRFMQVLKTAVFVAVGVTGLHVLFGEVFKFAPVLQGQLLRIWLIPTYLAFIAAAVMIETIWKERQRALKVLALASFIALLFNLGRFAPQAIEWPKGEKREWDRLQQWVRDNTAKDALFITPATRIGFRIHSQRAIVAERKDGSSGLYSEAIAREWARRISNLDYVGLQTQAEMIKLIEKYGADYLVTFTHHPYSIFSPVYKTENFIVYEL